MKRRYDDCQRQDGNCAACSLFNDGRDCHNNQVSNGELNRLIVEIVYDQLFEKEDHKHEKEKN